MHCISHLIQRLEDGQVNLNFPFIGHHCDDPWQRGSGLLTPTSRSTPSLILDAALYKRRIIITLEHFQLGKSKRQHHPRLPSPPAHRCLHRRHRGTSGATTADAAYASCRGAVALPWPPSAGNDWNTGWRHPAGVIAEWAPLAVTNTPIGGLTSIFPFAEGDEVGRSESVMCVPSGNRHSGIHVYGKHRDLNSRTRNYAAGVWTSRQVRQAHTYRYYNSRQVEQPHMHRCYHSLVRWDNHICTGAIITDRWDNHTCTGAIIA